MFIVVLLYVYYSILFPNSESSNVDTVMKDFNISGYWITLNKDWGIEFDNNNNCVDSNYNMAFRYEFNNVDNLQIYSDTTGYIDMDIKVLSEDSMNLQWFDNNYIVVRTDNLDDIEFYDWSAKAMTEEPLLSYSCKLGLTGESVLRLYSDYTYELFILNGTSTHIYHGKYFLNGRNLYLLYNRGNDMQHFLMFDDGCATSALEGYISSVKNGSQQVIVGNAVDTATGIHYVFNTDFIMYQYINENRSNMLKYSYVLNNGKILLTSINNKDTSYSLYYDYNTGTVYNKVYSIERR